MLKSNNIQLDLSFWYDYNLEVTYIEVRLNLNGCYIIHILKTKTCSIGVSEHFGHGYISGIKTVTNECSKKTNYVHDRNSELPMKCTFKYEIVLN